MPRPMAPKTQYELVLAAIVRETQEDPQWLEHGWVAFHATPEMQQYPRMVMLPDRRVMRLAGYVNYPNEDDVVTYELAPDQDTSEFTTGFMSATECIR